MKQKAIFVGVDDYREPLQSLSCAISDASKLSGLFENVLGFDTCMLSNPSSETVKATLRDFTSDLLPGDIFMFYFAGHGFTPISGGRQTLVCSTDEYDDVCQNWAGIPFDYVDDKTAKTGYSRIFIIDACRSALLPSRSVGADTRDLMPASEYVKERRGPAPYFLLQSCRRGQSAMEVKSRRRGLFSLALQELIKETVRRKSHFSFSHLLASELQSVMQRIATSEGFTAEQIPDPAGDVITLSCPCTLLGEVAMPYASAPHIFSTQSTVKLHDSELHESISCDQNTLERLTEDEINAVCIACALALPLKAAKQGEGCAQIRLTEIESRRQKRDRCTSERPYQDTGCGLFEPSSPKYEAATSCAVATDVQSIAPEGSIEIHVGNMSYDITETELSKIFGVFGNVSAVRIVKNRFNGKSKGYGFVYMARIDEAVAAIKALDDTNVRGCKLRCWQTTYR